MPELKIRTTIGQRIKDNTRDLTIIDQEIRWENPFYNKGELKKSRKCFVKVKCNICGWDENWIREYQLFNKKGQYKCSCCTNHVCVKGINDIATTHPEYLPYFCNIEDAYTHTFCSKDIVSMKCPECGNIKEQPIVYLKGKKSFCCPRCGDGYSIPEKFVYAFLQECGFKFVHQVSKKYFNWCEKYIYDFYIPERNMIIEVNGKQHYCTNKDYKAFNRNEKEIDIAKVLLAKKNGITAYSFIPVEESNFENLCIAVSDPKLLDFLKVDINNIDLLKCYNYAITSNIKRVCEYFNKNPSAKIQDIANLFQNSRTTIRRYLERGALLGLCNYNGMEHKKEVIKRVGYNNSKPVEAFKEGKSLGIFKSATDLANRSSELFGVQLSESKINSVCRGIYKTHLGFTFKRLTKGEYYDRSKNIS